MLLLLRGPGTPPVPVHLLGVYEEIFDFSLIISGIIINLDWVVRNISGSVSIQAQISTSTDGITFTAPAIGTTLFSTSMRYVKVRMEFTASNDKSAIEFANFRILLSVHSENDGGSISALAADAAGTRVTFNKSFKAVDSITITPSSSTTVFYAYDNADLTGFNVRVWNAAGVRVDKTVTWAARGVV